MARQKLDVLTVQEVHCMPSSVGSGVVLLKNQLLPLPLHEGVHHWLQHLIPVPLYWEGLTDNDKICLLVATNSVSDHNAAAAKR